MPTATPIRRRKPVFHTTAAKLSAVRELRLLMKKGLSKSKALTNIARGMKVSTATVHNWLHKYEPLTLNTNNVTTKHTNGRIVTGIEVKTESGIIKLTPADVKNIASLASTVC